MNISSFEAYINTQDETDDDDDGDVVDNDGGGGYDENL